AARAHATRATAHRCHLHLHRGHAVGAGPCHHYAEGDRAVTLTKLLSLLQSKGMALALSGDDLSVRGIEDALSDRELIASLREHRFVAALGRVVLRHDILRTSIAWEGLPSPVQVVHRTAELPFEIIDVPPDADAVAELQRKTGVQHRLDLARAPLMRCHAACD